MEDMMQTRKDYTGMRFSLLEVLCYAGHTLLKNGTPIPHWYCLCDCGKLKRVSQYGLVDGNIKSCGCWRVETMRRLSFLHGLSHTRIFKIRDGMIQRCCNPNHDQYHNYGGRGISICDLWKNDMQVFADWAYSSGYEDHLTIERIDNNAGYYPENCKWITREEQSQNKQSTTLYNINGINKTLREWCDEYNLNYYTIWSRLKRGYSIERALFTPKKVSKPAKYKDNLILEFNGECKTLKEWVGITKLPKNIIVERLKNGWSIEKALSKPKINRTRRK